MTRSCSRFIAPQQEEGGAHFVFRFRKYGAKPACENRVTTPARAFKVGSVLSKFGLTGLVLLSQVLSAAILPMAFGDQPANLIDLAGKWRFKADESDQGVRESWFQSRFTEFIELPGCNYQWGVGEPPPPTDIHNQNSFGWSPPSVFEGVAWYQKEIEIPESWLNKRVTLFIEQTRSDTRVWVDGVQVGGTCVSLTTPHVHDLTPALSPGRHVLTLSLDNRRTHGISGSYVKSTHGQGNWNGATGRIELRATERVWIERTKVDPDVAEKAIDIEVQIGSLCNAAIRANLEFKVSDSGGRVLNTLELPVSIGPGGANIKTRVLLGESVELWDEFTPAVYRLGLRLMTLPGPFGEMQDESAESFGMRSIAVTPQHEIAVNGINRFFRGTVSYGLFADTGYPHTDFDSWMRIFRIYKEWGLNHVRFHSWTPPEAAFDAADQLGIYLQPEAPKAGWVGRDVAADQFQIDEGRRIVERFGNHPSFVLMSMGNELSGSPAELQRILDGVRASDDRRLYAASTGGKGSDAVTEDFKAGGARGVRGPSTDWDFERDNAILERPAITHEVGQWHVYPDTDVIRKYTGVMRPHNLEMIRADLEQKDLLKRASVFTQESGRFSALLYKEEIESLLRTPRHSGFQLLMLTDFSGQGAATVGMLDLFEEPKGFISAEEFRRFCSPVVPLLRLAKRVYVGGEMLSARALVANHGRQSLEAATFSWNLTDSADNSLAHGSFPPGEVRRGELVKLGNVSISLPAVLVPKQLKLSVRGPDQAVRNDWDVWVYPENTNAVAPSGIKVCNRWEQARIALGSGHTVLFFPSRDELAAWRPGTFKTVFWSPLWYQRGIETQGILCDPAHPALAGFPTSSHCNWQWFNLLEHSSTIVIDGLPASFQPVVSMIDSFRWNQRLANLFEARVGNGRLMVCSIDLPHLQDEFPEARQLLRSLYAHLSSTAHAPEQSLDVEALDKLFTPAIERSLERPSELERADLRVAAPNLVSRTSPGFGYELSGAELLPGVNAWAGKKDVTLLINSPTPAKGHLFFQFHNTNPAGEGLQTAEEKSGVDYVEETKLGLAIGEPVSSVYLDNHLVGTLRGFGKEGRWFKIPVSYEAWRGGRLEIRFCTFNRPQVLSEFAWVPDF